MLINLEQLEIPAGQHIFLHNVEWQGFEQIMSELETKSGHRLAYSDKILEIMAPSFVHEDSKNIIADLVSVLLEELDTEFRNAGSTTFEQFDLQKGLEPDAAFYIENEMLVRGKYRLDLRFDPPPDLAIEIDITSRTHLNIYQALKVPELWRFNGKKLEILILEEKGYQTSEISRQFPHIPVIQLIPQYLKLSKTQGRNATMRAFRKQIQQIIAAQH